MEETTALELQWVNTHLTLPMALTATPGIRCLEMVKWSLAVLMASALSRAAMTALSAFQRQGSVGLVAIRLLRRAVSRAAPPDEIRISAACSPASATRVAPCIFRDAMSEMMRETARGNIPTLQQRSSIGRLCPPC